ncbi:hypothetical protein Cni_G10109 [Canna indica]|uniref:Uncharacterized protein n=1 Tax=Canna indica TaxID=4628 RepID=A0AAQ3QA15_9LILI|nr:hypothetical protein Cni_G10109 [Canna indica]
MDQATPQGFQFNNPVFTPPFLFPPPPTTKPQPASPSPSTPTKVETTSPSEVGEETQKSQIEEAEPKKFAFMDVSPEELLQNERSYVEESTKASPVDTESVKEIPPNGTLKQDGSASSEQSQSGQAPTILSVEALEKMMEDPTVQKMVHPNNMGGNNEWDNRLTEFLKKNNLSSLEVKQQFGKSNIVSSLIVMSIAEENTILKHTIFLK